MFSHIFNYVTYAVGLILSKLPKNSLQEIDVLEDTKFLQLASAENIPVFLVTIFFYELRWCLDL